MVERSLSMREVAGSMPAFSSVGFDCVNATENRLKNFTFEYTSSMEIIHQTHRFPSTYTSQSESVLLQNVEKKFWPVRGSNPRPWRY